MTYPKHVFRLSLMVSVMALAGCGGEGGDAGTSTPPPTEHKPMLAMNGFSAVTPDSETFVDLTQFIRGTNVSISAVQAAGDDERCGVPTVSGQGVNVDVEGGAFCEFTYTASQPGAKPAQASLNVLASTASEPILRPLSHALVVGGNDVTFNVQTLLGADWESTYSLQSATVQADNSSNAGSASIAGNVITFTPPTLVGWNRIVYILADGADADAPVMGEIYITVSNNINQPPAIAKPTYDYNEHNASTPITSGTKATLNLSTLTGLGITEPDSQEWQLVAVQSFTATVAATDPNSTDNKSIDFTASTVGDHFVSYIVADHFGGYSMGMIKVNVAAKGGAPTWTNITTAGNTYTAPQTYAQATEQGYLTSAIWDEPVNNTVAGYKEAAARNLCGTVGSLPTVVDMSSLRHGPDVELATWPMARPYLAREGDSVVSFDLSTGEISTYSALASYYVTCLENQSLSLNITKNPIVVNAMEQVFAEVILPPADTDFYITSFNGDDNNLTENDVNIRKGSINGSVTELVTQNTKAGDYRFVLVNKDGSETLISPKITYIGDASNLDPNLSTLTSSVDDIVVNNLEKATITLLLKDVYGNPISGQNVIITPSLVSSVKVTPVVDKGNGEYSIDLTASAVSTGSVSFDIEVNDVAFPVTTVSVGLLPTLVKMNNTGIGANAKKDVFAQGREGHTGFNLYVVDAETSKVLGAMYGLQGTDLVEVSKPSTVVPGKKYHVVVSNGFKRYFTIVYNHDYQTSYPDGLAYGEVLHDNREAKKSWANEISSRPPLKIEPVIPNCEPPSLFDVCD
ncbi:invasin domain 3-containing protein [Vibrio metoecus]|uniref:invasin domain 3-containing protein n=1 Tax=Vibrio metoecus TaxID=1481663 RepID=UPI0001B99A37|nr:invasin domain 3-containing protein [Vibrio metoecus]EEX66639.1 invasin [Vibrio metoecus]